MAFDSKNARADMAYPYHIDQVFDSVMLAAQRCSMSVTAADKVNHVLQLSKGMSMWTWGEKLVVYLGVLPDGRTGLTVICSSNLGTEIAARKQNQKNVQDLLNMLNMFIPGGAPQQMQMGAPNGYR